MIEFVLLFFDFQQSEEMLKLIPQLRMVSIERCSGHGGSFGVQKVLGISYHHFIFLLL
jgi:Fe-S oxidoreductase